MKRMAARAQIGADFHLLAQSLPQIVWVHLNDGTLEFANQRGLAYTGLRESDLAAPRRAIKLLHPHDRRRLRNRWRTAREGAAGYSLEARLRRGDGIYHWHLLQIHPMRDEQGVITRWLGTATDVHAAKESEDRSALLLALSTELARIADPHELLCTAMGRLRERLRATQATLAELDHEEREAILLTQVEEDGPRIEISALPIEALGQLAVQSRLARTTIVHDARHDSRAAQLRASEFTPLGIGALICVPLLRGGLPVALLFVVSAEPRRWTESEVELAERVADIVWPAFEKARADRALTASEERLRLAQSVARVGVWEWEPETDQCFLSPECQELFGLAPASPHRLNELLERIGPQDLTAVKQALEGCRSCGPREFEYRYRHPTRGQRWVHSKAGAVWHADRQRIFGIHLDVTERKHAEEALEEINQRKDEFLAMLAHELRNPLAPIRNAAQIMRLYAKGNSRLEWVRSVIERQSRHLTRLVDDLLDVSRIVRGQIVLEKSTIGLNDLIRHALEISRPLLRERKQELTVSMPSDSVQLEADLTRLAQVVANLLINAVKYTPEGGQIWLEAERAGKELILRVRDTGIGIAPSLLPRVFDLFTQGARTLDRAQGGLGIGLTLVKRIVEMHGGAVEATSAGLDRGSEFIVRLPLPAAPPAAAESPPARAAEGDDGRRVRVLVVDDNVDAADSIAMLLSLQGHEVLSVHAAHEALEAAQSFRPHLVLLDIGLPGMDGYEVARRLRSQQMESMRIIAMTGYGQPADRDRTRQAGFDQHLVKPIDPDILHTLIGSVPPAGRGEAGTH